MGPLSQSYIGAMCREYRRYYLKGCSQNTVALDCGVSRESVNKFENGHTSSAVIFMWYIKKGLFNWVPIEKWNGWSANING